MADSDNGYEVLGSGATKLWTAGVRQGPEPGLLSAQALEAERPFHLAAPHAELTLCGLPVDPMGSYPIDFGSLEPSARCSVCDEMRRS